VKLGRPKIDSATERKVRKQLTKGIGILKVAKSLGLGTGTVQRIAKERAMSPRGAQRGSPEATRRLVNKAFLEALAEDFRQGGAEAIARVRKEHPAAYMKICALLVPREMKLEHSGGVKAMTDEQLEASLAILKEMIAKRDAAASAKVIEGEAEVVPSLPAPGSGGTKMPKA
jgi:hypothetical protein